MKLEEIRDRLAIAYSSIIPIRGNLEDDFTPETALAIGELIGCVVKTWMLIEKDVEERNKWYDAPISNRLKEAQILVIGTKFDKDGRLIEVKTIVDQEGKNDNEETKDGNET